MTTYHRHLRLELCFRLFSSILYTQGGGRGEEVVKKNKFTQLEGLARLSDTASYRTVQVFRLVPFTYQLEYHCLSAAILK